MVDGIADAFASLIRRYGRVCRSRRRDSAAVAERCLSGLVQAEEVMAAVVEGGCAQQFQHFISNSPQDHEPVVAQIAADADQRLGGKPTSCLIIDGCSFPKQGDRSVGVARQWSGRLGKVDNRQVAVFGVLTDGQRHAPVDMRLYLPKVWIEDPARCDEAGVPKTARKLTSKSRHAVDIVRQARVWACGSNRSVSMPVTARSRASCARWMTRMRCSSPTSIVSDVPRPFGVHRDLGWLLGHPEPRHQFVDALLRPAVHEACQ